MAFMYFLLTSRGSTTANAQNKNGNNLLQVCPTEIEDWLYWDGAAWASGGENLQLKCAGSASFKCVDFICWIHEFC